MNLAFISDLHLSEETLELNSAFFNFLNRHNNAFDQLFILGDLFEVWLGDDDTSSFTNDISNALSKFSQKGTEIFFIHGNRDFLIGKNFLARSEMTVLSDPFIFQFFDKKIALSHGDIFCTDDLDYQNFKKEVRTQTWQNNFLSKSLLERKQIAANMRDASKSLSMQKQSTIMDVNENAVQKFAEAYSIDVLIHGHTHRPNTHTYENFERIVLGDWSKYGWVITLEDHKSKLEKFTL